MENSNHRERQLAVQAAFLGTAVNTILVLRVTRNLAKPLPHIVYYILSTTTEEMLQPPFHRCAH